MLPDDTPTAKTCTACGITKPLDDFYKSPNGRFGRQSRCIPCHKAASKRWVQGHPERTREIRNASNARNRDKVIARNRAFYAAHRERRLAEARAYKAKHRDRINERTREQRASLPPEVRKARWLRYRQTNPEQRRERSRAYQKANAAKFAAYAQERRARVRSAPKVERIDRNAIYDRDRGICHICGKHVPRKLMTLDHLIPLSKGGEHTARNLAVAHRSCNSKRGAGWLPAQLRLLG